MDSFNAFKADLVMKKMLWEDPDFPAHSSRLADEHRNSRYVKWLRPNEILGSQDIFKSSKPMFIVEGATRFDLNQGEIGNCWFIAAVACLAVSQEQLLNRTIPHDQDFEHNYAGVFRFHFWRFGKWVDVIVDDRLPTLGLYGKLLYASNTSQPNEFWVPLIEKAYAKLNGSYANIVGGITSDALVDFTGGISERIDLRPLRTTPSSQLFDAMYDMIAKSSLLACDIESNIVSTRPERNGLYKGHAYSITNLFRLTSRGQKLQLLRIRNPWGRDEWNGRWSDSSPEWASIPDKAKKEIGMDVRNDGEFWMCFEDFVSSFDYVWLCHLEPDAVSAQIAEAKHQSVWEMIRHESEWVRGFNAGGCGNAPHHDLFWTNPQFGIELKPLTDPATGLPVKHDVHVLISLMQHTVRHSENFGLGLFLFKVKDGSKILLDGHNYDQYSLQLAAQPSALITLREVSTHLHVAAGNYVIIPCTFSPNQETSFLLRVYTETNLTSQELDVPTKISEITPPSDNLATVFNQFTNNEPGMDAKELTNALNEIFKSDMFQFNDEMSRSLLHIYSPGDSGLLTIDQFRAAHDEVTVWKKIFNKFDKDRSGDIDTFELASVFSSVGLQLSRKVLESVVRKYGGKKRRMNFEDFVLCTSKITVSYVQFFGLKDNETNKVHLTLEEWLATTA